MKSSGINISEWVGSLQGQKPYYLAIINEEGILTFTNFRFYTCFLSPGESEGSYSFFDLVHQGDQLQLKASLAACAELQDVITTEIRIKNGHSRWVKWQICCVRRPQQAERFMCLGYDIAGDEQLEKAQQVLEQNCQVIVEDMNVGILLQDAEGEVISANQKIAEILNTTLESIYSKKNYMGPAGVEEPDPLSFAKTTFSSVIRTGQAQANVVLHFPLFDGRYRTLLCNSQPLFENEQPLPYSVVSTFQDITREKEFEMEAKSRNALFSAFMDHTPYFTWIVDQEEKLIYANRSLLDYFQLDEGAFGKKLEWIIPLSIAALIQEKHILARQFNRQDRSIIKSQMADGKEHVYQVIVFPIHGATPGLLIGGEALDITEAYFARKEEKKVSERLLYISKATSEAIWDWNLLTGQIYFNQALHDLVGTDLGQVFDLDWCYQRVHKEDLAKVEQTIKAALDNKQQAWEVEYRFQGTNGRITLMHNRGFIVYDNNEPIRMIGSLQDISEVRNLETQLVNETLKQQKGIAEAIIKAQEDERTRIGHELHDNINQILSSGNLYLSLLHEGIDNFGEIKEKISEILQLAIEEVRKLSRSMVVPDLKEGGLIASFQDLIHDLHFAGQFVVGFTHSKIADIESMTQNKKVTLYRIFQEQTKNIVKYSQAKNVNISLTIDIERVRLEIKDDGEGFDPAITRRGLGLSNIYERTRLYYGTVLLNTSPGKGCSIVVSIPM